MTPQPCPSKRLDPRPVRRVLIFRIGSLGDTVVALPSFHLIAKAFPEAERFVLTNIPEHTKAPPISTILGGSGLVHGYLEYPTKANPLHTFHQVRCQIRAFNPDFLVYLAPQRTLFQVFRDRLFFRLCGVKTVLGLPTQLAQRNHLPVPGTNLVESEAQRLLRCLEVLGDINPSDPAVWDLHLTSAEQEAAQQAMANLNPDQPTLALSLGTKQPVKEWGENNWRTLVPQLAQQWGVWNLLLLGSEGEADLSERISQGWPGSKANLCGRLSPRGSAAALHGARLFIGQDSGPMHLAAAMGVPCVGLFSGRDLPGIWFPWGGRHQVIYHPVPCSPCNLEVCLKHQQRCIHSITVDEVMICAHRLIERQAEAP